jgi:hypothetical protein
MSQTVAPISGSTAECLEHFSKHNPSRDVIDELTKFIGVKPPTVMEWLTSSRFPKGSELIKLRTFLVQSGYDVREFSSMPEDNQRFCLMVGFGVLNIDDVKRQLEYKDHQGALDLALRRRGVFKVRANEFDRLLRHNQSQLEAAIESFQQQRDRTPGARITAAASSQPLPLQHPQITPDNDQRLVIALVHNLHTASWLAAIVSGWDDSGREQLGMLLSDRELDLIISRIEKLRPGAAARSADS